MYLLYKSTNLESMQESKMKNEKLKKLNIYFYSVS